MDYAALYQKKLTSAAEAVKVVKSGDWVDYGAPTIPTRSTRLWPHARMSSRTSRSAAA